MITRIVNISIIDGSGRPPRSGEVIVRDGTIGQVSYRKGEIGAAAGNVFDGRGLTLAPGFIDAHGHSDISLLAAPEAAGKISQGITTEISGNCGLSPFPITDLNRDHLQELWKNYAVKLSWSDFNGYRKELARRRPALNLYIQCGHNTLRSAAAGYSERRLSAEQMTAMQLMLLENLRQGAAGFSTGLLYTPGVFADEDELLKLLQVAAPFLRPYTTHLRSEGDSLIESVEEAARLCRNSGQRYLHLSHLKTAGVSNHRKIDALLNLIDRENRDGRLIVTADRYPYIESLTQLSVTLPAPYDKLDDGELMRRLQDRAVADDAVAALNSLGDERLHAIRLVNTNYLPFQRYAGLKFLEIANICLKSAAALIVEILKHDAPGTMAAFSGMDIGNLRRILRRDYVACGTDESARPASYQFGVSHPRGFGSMPKFLQMLAEEEIPLERAIARITSLPAGIFNLSNRGLIGADMAADLVLFDPDRFHSDATFAMPHAFASGVDTVWVNGRIRYHHEQGKGVFS